MPKVPITAKIAVTDHFALKELACREQRTLSSLVRRALCDLLAKEACERMRTKEPTPQTVRATRPVTQNEGRKPNVHDLQAEELRSGVCP